MLPTFKLFCNSILCQLVEAIKSLIVIFFLVFTHIYFVSDKISIFQFSTKYLTPFLKALREEIEGDIYNNSRTLKLN